jgi:GLPGLI family protein
MKKIILIAIVFINAAFSVNAQQFIDKAVIEFEVKTNIKKTMSNSSWAELLKENLPQFKTGYFNFSFDGGKSVYKFDHWDEKAKVPEYMRSNDEQNIYIFDHEANKIFQQKSIFGSVLSIEDSIPKINWRLGNENRMIAGFNCKKATGKIGDSVYVFAFYTDEIMIPGGPCSINGLPGMILGLTIPRMYTSFIATKVMLNGVKTEDLKPMIVKKSLSRAGLSAMLLERSKEWGSSDDEDDNAWKNQFIWGALL